MADTKVADVVKDPAHKQSEPSGKYPPEKAAPDGTKQIKDGGPAATPQKPADGGGAVKGKGK